MLHSSLVGLEYDSRCQYSVRTMTMLHETVIEKRESHPDTGLDQSEPQRIPVEGEVDLIELATILLREKKSLFKWSLALSVLAAAVVYLVMKPMYTAEAVFLPPQNSPGSNMALQLTSQLGSLGGAAGALGLK